MRLIIVSNRMPVVVSHKNGDYQLAKGAGGLVSGLSDFLKSIEKSESDLNDYLWMGWPGMDIPKKDEDLIRGKILEKFNAAPVFLSQELMDKVYFGFCNKTIWPLFHYFPTYAKFRNYYWSEYKKLNEIFRDELLKIIEPDDIIWVHDYHLMLLPGMLREAVSNPIGFFLHIPFPSYEMYRTLPGDGRNQILEGLLGADLVGFHTHDYSQYYLTSVRRLLGVENHMGQITLPDRAAKVDTFPMGIDFEKFNGMKVCEKAPRKPGAEEMKMVLSVDRLDYSKGIARRLQGFEIFLKENPQWHEKVFLNMIVVPSRTKVSSYFALKRRLDELVGMINGAFGNIRWTPVVYQYTSLPHSELIAQYRNSNVALLTPLRDGMNLVAKEYVASLTDKKGMLILSEFTGAAKELGEAIIINPNSRGAIANAIKGALEMPEEEQIKRNELMQKRLKRYNVFRWADDFVNTLVNIRKDSQETSKKKKYTPEIADNLVKDFKKAKNRIIIVNYDGTLVPYQEDPAIAEPGENLLNLLEELQGKENTDLVILSGRSRNDLDKWLGKLPVGLTAEHGAWLRSGTNPAWELFKPLSADWKQDVMDILEMYTDRLPGSYIEEKEYSVTWNFFKADVEQADFLAREVNDHLVSITENINVQVMQGYKVIEVANSGINKGELATYWLSKKKYDYVLAIGAGWSDELLFQTLPECGYSFKVGQIQTQAKYVLKKQQDAIKLLEMLKES